jgi:hypothetical protein
VSGIDVGSPGLGIEALEHILPHERFAVDKVDLVGGGIKHPEIAVAGDVYEAFYFMVRLPCW